MIIRSNDDHMTTVLKYSVELSTKLALKIAEWLPDRMPDTVPENFCSISFCTNVITRAMAMYLVKLKNKVAKDKEEAFEQYLYYIWLELKEHDKDSIRNES